MRRKFILSITLGLLIAFSAFLLLPYFQKNGNNTSISGGLSLLIPPAYATTTPPLDTTQIAFIAYYQRTVGWTLANTIPAFVSYTDGGNYYDGIVRVWNNGGIGATGSGHSVDVHVRVRSDGWILAWLTRSNDAGDILYWNAGGSYPSSSQTSISRAIEIVYYVAGVGFPGYDAIGIYDYSQPTATRLLVFGTQSTSTWYYTLPTSSPLVPIKLIARCICYYGGGGSLYIDNGQVFSTSAGFDWKTYVLDQNVDLSKGTQHVVGQSFGLDVALIAWAG